MTHIYIELCMILYIDTPWTRMNHGEPYEKPSQRINTNVAFVDSPEIFDASLLNAGRASSTKTYFSIPEKLNLKEVGPSWLDFMGHGISI